MGHSVSEAIQTTPPRKLLAHVPIYCILQQSVSNTDTGRSWRRRYSYSAVALNYLTSAVVMLEAIFFIGLVQQMIFGPKRCALQVDPLKQLRQAASAVWKAGVFRYICYCRAAIARQKW